MIKFHLEILMVRSG